MDSGWVLGVWMPREYSFSQHEPLINHKLRQLCSEFV